MALTFCGLCISIGFVSPTKPQFGSRHHFHTISLYSIIYKQAPACLRVGLDHPWDCLVPFSDSPVSQPPRLRVVPSPAVWRASGRATRKPAIPLGNAHLLAMRRLNASPEMRASVCATTTPQNEWKEGRAKPRSERPDTWVTVCTGHMGDTLSL